jgi:hypothetical protein
MAIVLVLSRGQWRSRLVWFLILLSSFCRRISFSANRQIIRQLACQQARRTEPFGALPCFELGWRWRCRRGIESEGEGDGGGDGDGEGEGE